MKFHANNNNVQIHGYNEQNNWDFNQKSLILMTF